MLHESKDQRSDSTSLIKRYACKVSLIKPTAVGPNTNPIKFMIKSMSAEAAALIDRGASVWVMPKVGPV